MSPRMVAELENHAAMHSVSIIDGTAYIVSYEIGRDIDRDTRNIWCDIYTDIFKYAARCLNAKIVPTKENILTTWPNAPRGIITHQPRIELAMKAVFRTAVTEGTKSGNGEFERCMMNWDEDERPNLKRCRNDDEYGFVAAQCGFSI